MPDLLPSPTTGEGQASENNMLSAECRAIVRRYIQQGYRFRLTPEQKLSWIEDLEHIRTTTQSTEERIDAIKTLAALELMNQRDEHLAVKVAARVMKAESPKTVNNTQINIAALRPEEVEQLGKLRQIVSEVTGE